MGEESSKPDEETAGEPRQQADSGSPEPEPAPAETWTEVPADPEDETAALRAERDGYLDDLKRIKAEFENYRKRILKEQTEFVERASASLVSSLLPVLDNFDLAVSAAEDTKEFDKMLRGIEMVYGELKEVLKGEGLRPIEARGQRFDPNLHEAALEIPGAEEGELEVVEVLRPGYTFKGRVLRPAMVKVRRT
ncbi:MAG: nucleotide exchange factor GrpE [Actinomycetota bacterium]